MDRLIAAKNLTLTRRVSTPALKWLVYTLLNADADSFKEPPRHMLILNMPTWTAGACQVSQAAGFALTLEAPV